MKSYHELPLCGAITGGNLTLFHPEKEYFGNIYYL